MTRRKWRAGLLAMLACLLFAGCTGIGYRPGPNDRSGPVHGDSGGAGGGSM